MSNDASGQAPAWFPLPGCIIPAKTGRIWVAPPVPPNIGPFTNNVGPLQRPESDGVPENGVDGYSSGLSSSPVQLPLGYPHLPQRLGLIDN